MRSSASSSALEKNDGTVRDFNDSLAVRGRPAQGRAGRPRGRPEEPGRRHAGRLGLREGEPAVARRRTSRGSTGCPRSWSSSAGPSTRCCRPRRRRSPTCSTPTTRPPAPWTRARNLGENIGAAGDATPAAFLCGDRQRPAPSEATGKQCSALKGGAAARGAPRAPADAPAPPTPVENGRPVARRDRGGAAMKRRTTTPHGALRSRVARAVTLTVVGAPDALTGCDFTVYSLPLPGGADLGDDPYTVTVAVPRRARPRAAVRRSRSTTSRSARSTTIEVAATTPR